MDDDHTPREIHLFACSNDKCVQRGTNWAGDPNLVEEWRCGVCEGRFEFVASGRELRETVRDRVRWDAAEGAMPTRKSTVESGV